MLMIIATDADANKYGHSYDSSYSVNIPIVDTDVYVYIIYTMDLCIKQRISVK